MRRMFPRGENLPLWCRRELLQLPGVLLSFPCPVLPGLRNRDVVEAEEDVVDVLQTQAALAVQVQPLSGEEQSVLAVEAAGGQLRGGPLFVVSQGFGTEASPTGAPKSTPVTSTV